VSTATKPPNLPAKAQQGESFLALLERSRPQIGHLVPKDNVERVVRVARTAYLTNPAIQRCTPLSILSAVLRACELNLEPGGALQHAYLVPYGADCQFQLGYRGMLELARRSGQFRSIDARVVRQEDRFELSFDPEPTLKHVPVLHGEAGEITHAYAYARLIDGSLVVSVMTRAEVESIRKKGSANSPAWRDHWSEMAAKTVLKRMLKRQPCSVTIREALESDTEGLSPAAAGWDDEPDFAEGVPRPLYSEADDPDAIEPVPATATHRRAPQAAQKAVPSGDLDADDASWDQGRE
jgi:recombination protein RecT